MFARSQTTLTECGCDADCGEKCKPSQRKECIDGACEEVLDSVQDRRDNGGAAQVIRTKALNLIELLFADLES